MQMRTGWAVRGEMCFLALGLGKCACLMGGKTTGKGGQGKGDELRDHRQLGCHSPSLMATGPSLR